MRNRHPVMQMKTATCFCVKWAPWEDYFNFITEWTLAVLCKYKLATQGKGCFLLSLSPLYSHSTHSSFYTGQALGILVRNRVFHKREQLIVYEYSRYSHYQGLWSSWNPDFKPALSRNTGRGVLQWEKEKVLQFIVPFLEAGYKSQ